MVRRLQLAIWLAILLPVAAGWVFFLAAAAAPLGSPAAGQEVGVEIHALGRLFPEIGPGLETLKRDAAGKYYVVAAPGHSVAIFDAEGNRVGQIPNDNSHGATISFAEDIDLDADGRLLVVDRGAKAVKIFAADGSLAASVPVAAPTSVVALVGGDFAVSTVGSSPAINIYNVHGKRLQTFGSLPAATRQWALNRYLNLGIMCGDLAGHIYFAYSFLPDPIIRKYDRYGYATYEIDLSADEFTGARDAHRDPLSLDRRPASSVKPVIGALAADPATQEVWAAIGNTLLYFDKDGNRRAAYRTFTPEGARLEPRAILVEPERILLGADPLGIFAFARPEKARAGAAAH
jgi:hypothetical protein